MIAVALAILGHEVDSEAAYEDMVTDSTDIFVDLVKSQLKWAAGALTAAGVAQFLELGPWGWIALGIAVGVTIAVDVIYALWAPADKIMEDAIGLTTLDLALLTSADFPAPLPVTYTTSGGIEVSRSPLDKVPTQYRETRAYVSGDEESRYELTLRFNRMQ
jgi:hypothetical protein